MKSQNECLARLNDELRALDGHEDPDWSRAFNAGIERAIEIVTVYAVVSLTEDEVAALQKAREHVRVHMAHEHSWKERDAAMEALGKVIAAAQEKS